MKLHLTPPASTLLKEQIKITGSKSESNRLLLLQALFPNITIDNISNSDDAQVMQKGLAISDGIVDIHHAGTAMRFLTGYFASQKGKNVVLTGSKRMTERPIKVLVDALKELGADISYEQEEGYPPIKIQGKTLSKSKVSLPANISSQYISALLLIAPSLEHGITLELVGKITSVPYIKMTLSLLNQLGIETSFEGNVVTVAPMSTVNDAQLVVESDWSSASYFYSIAALSEVGTKITISSYKKDSLQGDSVLATLYKSFGVESVFTDHALTLKKISDTVSEPIDFDLANAPDIAQTIAVTCFGLGVGCHLSGLHTLKIKETDRLEALHTELSKLGASISVTDKTLTLAPATTYNQDVAIDTYDDHRMAMAFAPLALKISLKVNDAEVVSKSYPDFWKDMAQVHIDVKEL